MDGSSTVAGPDTPVERFKPTSGYVLGYLTLVLLVVFAGYVVRDERNLTGVRIGLVLLFAATLVWATQIRPRASATRHALRLQNSFQDVHVPLAAIDTVTMRQTLNVWVGEQRFVCIGIGQGIRSRRKDRGDRPSLLGTSRWHEFSEMAKKAAPDQTAMSYQSWVVVRIEELVEQAKKARGGEAGAHEVRRSLAVPELALLALTAVAFVVTFVV